MSKKLVERRKKWNFTPFPYDLTVVISNDITASRNKYFPHHPYAHDKYTSALTNAAEDLPNAIIFLDNSSNIKYIAHEVSHVVWYFMKFIGAKPENEFQAYYIGWLTYEVAKFALDKKKKVRYTKNRLKEENDRES